VLLLSFNAGAIELCNTNKIEEPLKLTPYATFFEDSSKTFNAEGILSFENKFASSAHFTATNWRSTYWTKFDIKNCSDKELLLSLFFNNLTHVELYEFKNGELVRTHSAGLFRSKKEISQGDHHNYFTLRIEKDGHITYLLKTDHSKGYKPHLEFSIQDHSFFQIAHNKIVRFDYFIFGTFFIFIIYTLLTFLFNKYRPYFWLGVFTFGMAFYGFTMRGQMLNFFPNHPEFFWRLNSLFTSLSGIGGFMMISTFFNMRKLSPFFHKLLLFLVGVEVVQLIVGQLIISINNNYSLMTLFSIIVSALLPPVIIFIPLRVWGKLTRPQKIFSVAIFFYACLLVLGLMILFLWKEGGIVVVTYLNSLSGIVAIGFFTISLGEQMRAIEVERNQILIEINQLKNEQNATLELLVERRTKELSDVNIELVNQKEVLHQRNERIELLLRELHHRVKNNLQLISSFYDLRLEDPVRKELSAIISEGKNRINVMAMVHNMLYHGNDLSVIDTCSFVHQIAAHLQAFFNRDQLIETQIICSNLKFDMDTALPLGLIFNELLTNTYKHTKFEAGRKMVMITIEPTKKYFYRLTISDNGAEIKMKIVPKKTQSFGLQMIYLLSKQLNGSFDYHYDGKNNFIVDFMDTEGRQQIE
jgi:two-component sensor histidine kinase